MEIGYFSLNIKTNQIKIDEYSFISYFKFFPTLFHATKYVIDIQNEKIYIFIKFDRKIKDILKTLEVVKDKIEIIKILSKSFNSGNFEILFDKNRYNIFIDSTSIEIYDKETLLMQIKDCNNNFNLLTKILDELIKKEVFLNHAISYLNEIRNNLFSCFKEDKLNSNEIEEVSIYIETENRNVEIENKVINLQILTNIVINNENKVFNHILNINQGNYCISLKYFPDLISDLVNNKLEFHLIEDQEDPSKICYLLVCNNKKYFLHKKGKTIVIKDSENENMVFSCPEYSGFIDIFIKMGMVNVLLRNKDIILNLFEKYKNSLIDKIINFIDNILFELNDLKY
jgi:hypothetical protein